MSKDMLRASIFDGQQPNNAVRVSGEGALLTEMTQVPGSVTTTTDMLGTTSEELLAENAQRLQFQLQNLDATKSIHILLGAGTATTGDLRIGPGQMYSLPPGVVFTGAIQAIGSDTEVDYVLVVFNKPAS